MIRENQVLAIFSAVNLIFVSLAVGVSCTEAKRARIGAYGDEHKVELYSGGEKVREWISTGKVRSEDGSDGYYFNDKASGVLVEVAGDLVITRL